MKTYKHVNINININNMLKCDETNNDEIIVTCEQNTRTNRLCIERQIMNGDPTKKNWENGPNISICSTTSLAARALASKRTSSFLRPYGQAVPRRKTTKRHPKMFFIYTSKIIFYEI